MMIEAQQLESLGENVKVVLFIEDEPLSDSFSQIMLTLEQKKRILQAIQKEMEVRPEGGFDVWMSSVHQYEFPDIKDDYTLEEIHDPNL